MPAKPSQSKRKLLGLTGIAALTLPAIWIRRVQADHNHLAAINQPSVSSDLAFIERAFEMRQKAIELGDQGYGAVVVRDSEIVGQAASHVVVNHDPTAHAELEAIRDAANRLGRRDLAGCTLYSSSPPCPMCEAAAYWANIERMVSGKRATDSGRPSLC